MLKKLLFFLMIILGVKNVEGDTTTTPDLIVLVELLKIEAMSELPRITWRGIKDNDIDYYIQRVTQIVNATKETEERLREIVLNNHLGDRELLELIRYLGQKLLALPRLTRGTAHEWYDHHAALIEYLKNIKKGMVYEIGSSSLIELCALALNSVSQVREIISLLMNDYSTDIIQESALRKTDWKPTFFFSIHYFFPQYEFFHLRAMSRYETFSATLKVIEELLKNKIESLEFISPTSDELKQLMDIRHKIAAYRISLQADLSRSYPSLDLTESMRLTSIAIDTIIHDAVLSLKRMDDTDCLRKLAGISSSSQTK